MSTHKLKTWPQFFNAVACGDKTFEARKNDRDFDVGDTLVLQEYDPVEGRYLGREVVVSITFILLGPQFGIEIGYCVLGIRCVDDPDIIKEQATEISELRGRINVLEHEISEWRFRHKTERDYADILREKNLKLIALAEGLISGVHTSVVLFPSPTCIENLTVLEKDAIPILKEIKGEK